MRLLPVGLSVALAGSVLGLTTAAARPAPQPTVTLPNLLAHLGLAHATGRVAPASTMRIEIALAHPDPAGEQAAYDAMYDPTNPGYHDFLTPSEYDARFGVPAATVQSTLAWVKHGGLNVESVSDAGDLVAASGTVGAVERLLNTTIDSFTLDGQSFLANTTRPSVPAALPIATVMGLNTAQRFQAASPVPASTSVPSPATFTAADLAHIYDAPPGDQGQGQSLGVFGEGATSPVIANLRVAEQRQHEPAIPVRVVQTRPGSYGDVGGEGEWDLDTQSSTGMAPKAKQLTLYFAPTFTDADVVAAFGKWAADPQGPAQASASFGECEADPLNQLWTSPLFATPLPLGLGVELGDNTEAAAEPILRRATLEGRTLFASTGDSGGLCAAVGGELLNGVTPGQAPFADYPAASDYAVAVGGTTLSADAANTHRISEVAWTYGGGGPAAFIAEPGFQKGVSAVNSRCLSKPNGQAYPAGTMCRGVPDVAADAGGGVPLVGGDATFDAVVDMVNTPVAGTSLSAPLVQGMWALIQAGAGPKGLGFANESLYRVAATSHYHRDFYDVTASEYGIGNFTNQPKPGWDYTTGLGVTDIAHLMDDLDHTRSPRAAATPAAAPTSPVCKSLLTNPAGFAVNPVTAANDPSVDFTKATFALSGDGKSLVLTMTGPQLDFPPLVPDVGGGAYSFYWTYKGTTYFADLVVVVDGFVLEDGHVDAKMGPVVDHEPTGAFNPGTLQLTVPLKDVGKPPRGSTLSNPYAVTSVSPLVVLSFTTAAAGGRDVVLSPCAKT